MVATDGETAKAGKISKKFLCNLWEKQRHEYPTNGGASSRSGDGAAPSRKGCVVNGQMTKATNK